MVVQKETAGLLGRLTALLGDRVTTNTNIRHQHGHDEGYRPGQPPDMVVFPLTTSEVSAVYKTAQTFRSR